MNTLNCHDRHETESAPSYRGLKCLLVCLALLVGVPFTGGCADKDSLNRGEVSGKVMLDGQPAKGGTILFRPTADNVKGTPAGTEINDGYYFIPRKVGPIAGNNYVQFVGALPSGKKVIGRGDVEEDEYVSVFPASFGQRTSDVHKIEPGKNVIDFDLKSK